MTRRTNFEKWIVLKNKDDYFLSLKQLHEWGLEPYVKLWNAIQGRDPNTSYWLSRKQIDTAQNILLGYFALTKSADYARGWDPGNLKYFKNLLSHRFYDAWLMARGKQILSSQCLTLHFCSCFYFTFCLISLFTILMFYISRNTLGIRR